MILITRWMIFCFIEFSLRATLIFSTTRHQKSKLRFDWKVSVLFKSAKCSLIVFIISVEPGCWSGEECQPVRVSALNALHSASELEILALN